MYSAVIFDLDGTLLNTLTDLANAGNHTLEVLGFPTHPVDAYRYLVGNGIPKLIERMLPEKNRGPATQQTALSIFLRYYEAHKQDTTAPYPGILPMLQALKGAGLRLGVVSNKENSLSQEVAAHYFPGLFDAVAGHVLGTPTKPDPHLVNEMRAAFGLAPEQVEEILAFISITGSNEKVLEALARYEGKNELFDQGLQELRSVTAYLGQFGVPEENFAVDLTIARGLDYYTGTVYETTLLDHPEIGSVCSGGRYDNLAGYYTDRQLPGVGISIGLTRLFYVLGEQGLLNPALPTAPADALVLPMTANAGPAISVATCLREAGIRTQVYLEQKKFKQKMSYADKLGIPYAVLLGEDELREGKCSVKDLATGEQVTVTPEEAARRIAQGMAEKNRGAVILEK